jgi:hypothetical protein
MPAPSTHGGSGLAGRIFFLTGYRATGEAALGPDAIDLADTDLHLALVLDGLLDPPTWNRALGAAECFEERQRGPTKFGAVAVTTLGDRHRRISMELALEPGNGGAMEGHSRKRLIGSQGGKNLLFGCALRDRLWFNGHVTLARSESVLVG